MKAMPGSPETASAMRTVCVFVIVAVACFAAGCDSTDCTNVDSAGPVGRLIRITGCKTWTAEADTGATPSNLECAKWVYNGESILLLTHVNAGFNCCPKIRVDAYVEGDTIFVREYEIEGLCDCLCLFDFYYDFHGIHPGIYRVTFPEEAVSEGEEPLDFLMDLTTSPSGSYCVDRNNYPWGH